MTTDIQLSKNFKRSEFLHLGSLEGVTPEIEANLGQLAIALEGVRVKLGNRVIHINSGFRTVAHNLAVGGVEHSQHLYGLAADIEVEGLTPQQVQKIMEDWPGGLEYAPTWTHLDLGSHRRFTIA